MKTRSGFVSNSSSSSFVVAFPRRPHTVVEMQELLFDANQTVYCDPYYDGGWPVATVAEVAMMQLRDQEPLDKDGVIDCICSGYIRSIYKQLEHEFDDRYDSNKTMEQRRELWRARDKRERELATEYANDWFLRLPPDQVLFKFEFSDNDGSMNCALEHGDLFRRLPHITVSHH